MELISAVEHGWAKLRQTVFSRDGGCVAVQRKIFGDDMARDLCRDRNGWAIRWNDFFKLEFDHVKEELAAGVRSPHDEAHGVAVCPWHHRGDRWRSDTKEHRAVLRGMLAKLYPAVWQVHNDDAG